MQTAEFATAPWVIPFPEVGPLFAGFASAASFFSAIDVGVTCSYGLSTQCAKGGLKVAGSFILSGNFYAGAAWDWFTSPL